MKSLKVYSVAFALLLSSSIINAATVTYQGYDYVVSYIESSFYDSQSLLESQIWWGDEALTIYFSDQVNTELGALNDGASSQFGAMFLYQSDPSYLAYAWDFTDARSESWALNPNFSESYAIVTSSAASVVPIPAAAWLFGSGLLGLIGVARRNKVA